MTKCVYIDGDVLMYRAAFSAEITKWGIIEPDGECYIVCDTQAQALQIVKTGAHGYCTTKRVHEALPFERAVSNLNNDIAEICKNTHPSYRIFLSHPDRSKNDRYNIATTHPYKGNRKNQNPPIHKKAVFEHMSKMHRVYIVEGIEADDALGTALFNDKGSICASIDKDLLMVPGLHYNMTHKNTKEASDPGALEIIVKSYGKKLIGTGFKWFCAQMLMGDSVDNIVGLRGYGPVKTFGVLNGCSREIGMWHLVRNHYAMNDEKMDRVDENAKLLWIRRNKNETFWDWMERK